MADTGTTAGGGADAGGGAARRSWKGWLVSLGLVAATLLLAASCIFILSSVLAQARLSSITIDGVTLSVRKLFSIGDQWRTTRDQIQTELQLRNTARNQRIQLSVSATAAEVGASAIVREGRLCSEDLRPAP
jgi:hypothetical protein